MDLLQIFETDLPLIASSIVATITALSVIFTKYIKPYLKSIKRGQLRNELILLIETSKKDITPEIIAGIENRYLQYHELGGNSYIDAMFNDFMNKYKK